MLNAPVGNHYKTILIETSGVMATELRLIGYLPSPHMSMATVEKVVEHFCPKHKPVTFVVEKKEFRTKFTTETLKTAGPKLKSNKAPGPGNISLEVIKLLLQTNPKYLFPVYNTLPEIGNFPKIWKQTNLILIKIGNFPKIWKQTNLILINKGSNP
ncbi:hypothetical protein QE152_g1052 [Popillia japonica]|uniref:Uncharacterized protein n=1 Tax=Popillia japonica TaxID=7064 RepID=A0AAW1N5P4_POPJA